jgi:hypothetical protein
MFKHAMEPAEDYIRADIIIRTESEQFRLSNMGKKGIAE